MRLISLPEVVRREYQAGSGGISILYSAPLRLSRMQKEPSLWRSRNAEFWANRSTTGTLTQTSFG